MSRVRV